MGVVQVCLYPCDPSLADAEPVDPDCWIRGRVLEPRSVVTLCLMQHNTNID
jgi:hypothetical protein